MVKNISLLITAIKGVLVLMLGQFNVEDYWSLIIEPLFPVQKNWRGYKYLILTVFVIELFSYIVLLEVAQESMITVA